MLTPWFRSLWTLIGVLATASAIGFVTELPLLIPLLGTFTYLLWHMLNLYRLDKWFEHGRKEKNLPEAPGIWGNIYQKLYRLQNQNRKRKRKLRNMLKRFQASTKAMPDATIVLDSENRIEWMNPAAVRFLGLRPSQDMGQYITNLIRSPVFHEYLQNADDTAGSVKVQSPLDPNITLRIHVVPYAGKQRLFIARDISEVSRLEQIRQDFIANASHELRTPLTVINGFIETMCDADEEVPPQWQRPLALIAQQTVRMQRIIDDMLLLSRLESETPGEDAESLPVADVLEALCQEARIMSGDQGHQITLKAEPNLYLRGWSEELRSAFSNIIVNAVKYTPDGGDINVRWYADEKGAHMEVEDTGEGIARQHIPRLTERFYRVDVGRSRNQGGTGLGLAIVKHVLNRHSGYLDVESEPGIGSTFRCNFPPEMIVGQMPETCNETVQ